MLKHEWSIKFLVVVSKLMFRSCSNMLGALLYAPREAVVDPTWPKRLEFGSQKIRSKQRTTLFKLPNPNR